MTVRCTAAIGVASANTRGSAVLGADRSRLLAASAGALLTLIVLPPRAAAQSSTDGVASPSAAAVSPWGGSAPSPPTTTTTTDPAMAGDVGTVGPSGPTPAAVGSREDAARDEALEHLAPPRDISWAEDIERGCEHREGMRYASCDGPRRVVVPTDEARERAERLGLGTHATADTLWTGAPRPEWL